MYLLDPFLALASVLAVSIFLVLKAKIPAPFAPLIALCAAPLWLTLWGLAGLLQLGGWLWYLLAAVLLVVAVEYKAGSNNYKKLASPAFVLFFAAALSAALYLAIRQPMLHEWDEFSLWGTGVKLMKVTGQMHTVAPMGWAWSATQTPTLLMTGYFAQIFGAFAAWKIYAGYAFLLLAVVAAVVGTIPAASYSISVPVAFIGLLTPWAFAIYNRKYAATPVWLLSYGDIPAGMLLGGTLALYFGLRREKAPLWPVFIPLAALALVKDNTFVFALVAAGIMVADLLLFADRAKNAPRLRRRVASLFTRDKKKAWQPQPGSYTLAKRLGLSAGFFAAAALPFVVWNRHIAAVVAQRAAAGEVASTSEDLLTVVIICFKMLFNIEPRTPQFSQALSNMLEAYFSIGLKRGPGGIPLPDDYYPISMFGGNIVITLLIVGIFAAAIIFAGKGALRRRAAVALGLSAGGFVGYYLLLLFSYGRIFKSAALISYNRYITAYYIGWFLLAVCFLALAARECKPHSFARLAALALAVVMVLRTGVLLPLQNSDVGYPDAFFTAHRTEEKIAQSVLAALPDEGEGRPRVFFVSQGDSFGERWFHYSYWLLPALVDYSINAGGSLTAPLPGRVMSEEYKLVTAIGLQKYLTKSGCEYMMVERLDDEFIQSYKALFTDELAGAVQRTTLLYRVVGEGLSLRLEPVEMEVPPR